MKKIRLFFYVAIIGLLGVSCSDDDDESTTLQTITFEDVSLPSDTVWFNQTKEGTLGTNSWGDTVNIAKKDVGAASLYTEYNPKYGGSWSGFAISTKTNKITAGYINEFSVYGNGGVDNSKKFAVFYNNTKATLEFKKTVSIKSLYLTNGTYPYLSMLNGDSYAKKFTSSDWFKVRIFGYNGNNVKDSVDFFLAEKGVIVSSWTKVDVSKLGSITKIGFRFFSSDTGNNGINTPGYFCIDNISFE